MTTPGDPLPPPVPPQPAERPGIWRRFQARPRWQRWTAYGTAAFVGLAGLGAAVGEQPPERESITASSSVASTSTSSSSTVDTVASTPPPPTAAPSTSSTTTTTTTTASTTTAASTVPATTAAPTTVPGSLLALDVLALIPVTNENQDPYDRDRFGYPADRDGDGCDTRDEVLQRDSLTPAQVDPSGCQVLAGDWYSTYDGVTHTDPTELQVDHVVALSEAWDSGAWAWGPERLTAYGNDLDDARSLRAVTGAVNNDKGDKDPSNWLPPNPAAVCGYLADWTAVKARWGLSMDESEAGRIRNVLTDQCPGQAIAPWPQAPVDTPAPTTVAPPPIQPAVPQVPTGNCDPSYPTVCIPPSPPDLDCGDIPYRRFTVLPPDPHRFDGADDDGVGCEGG